MYELLIPFLILLGSIIPPIGGVIMADFFYRHRGQYPKLAEAHLPVYNSLGLAAYVLGAACAYFAPGWRPSSAYWWPPQPILCCTRASAWPCRARC